MRLTISHLNDAILGAGRYDIVIVRTPGYIQHRSFVTADQRMIGINSANLSVGMCIMQPLMLKIDDRIRREYVPYCAARR